MRRRRILEKESHLSEWSQATLPQAVVDVTQAMFREFSGLATEIFTNPRTDRCSRQERSHHFCHHNVRKYCVPSILVPCTLVLLLHFFMQLQ